MNLDPRTASLVAVGASVAANCQPCLEINAGRALRYGAAQNEIADAIEVGRRVRAGAASKLDGFATRSVLSDSGPSSDVEASCECGSSPAGPGR